VDRTVDTIPFATPHSLYGLWSVFGAVNTPNRALTWGLNAGYGTAPIFAEGAEGRELDLGANAVWRPTASLRVEALWTHQRITRSRDGSRFSTADIPRLKLEYQLTREIFFRYVGQYFAQDQAALVDPRTGQPLLVSGATAGPSIVNDFRSDVLFSYKPTPGTVFFFGYGASLDEVRADISSFTSQLEAAGLLVASATALVICSPLFILAPLLIWAEDGAPVLFSQERVGRDGKRFILLKFRTMRLRGDQAHDDMYTRERDRRVTRVGRRLRKLRLDELPQLWNALRGDISLIGPRAEWSKCAERYEQTIPFYHFRHLVKPGITGWAQVNYPYGENDDDAVEKLKYDLYYIRHYSLKLDAMIVLKTLYTMLFGKGR